MISIISIYARDNIFYSQLVSQHLDESGFGGSGNILPTALKNYTDKEEVIDYTKQEKIAFGNTALYSPFSYIPQSLGIFIAKCFTNNVSKIFIGGRLGSLVINLILCIWALKKMPFAKEVLFIIMMLPMSMQEMISLAPDGFTTSLTIAFIAYVLYLSYGKNSVNGLDKAIIISLSICLSLCKIVYIVIILMIFIIPKTKFKDKYNGSIFKGVVLFAAVLLNLIWLKISSGFLGEFTPGVNSEMQIIYILTHLFDYYIVVIRTLVEDGGMYIHTMLGSNLGALNIIVTNTIWITSLILIIVVTVTSSNKINYSLKKTDIIWFALIFISGLALICTSLYVQWTPYMNIKINGIQGRYFIPLLAFLLLPIVYILNWSKLRLYGIIKNNDMNFKFMYRYLVIIFINIYSLMTIINYYI